LDDLCDHSVQLRTGTCYIRGIFVLYLQDYCALQELIIKMSFTLAVAPPIILCFYRVATVIIIMMSL